MVRWLIVCKQDYVRIKTGVMVNGNFIQDAEPGFVKYMDFLDKLEESKTGLIYKGKKLTDKETGIIEILSNGVYFFHYDYKRKDGSLKPFYLGKFW